jgi:hypothetical protein
MIRMSVPASGGCVTKLCRKVWTVTGLLNSACRVQHPLAGRWQITTMELWEANFFGLVQPAFISFDGQGSGGFTFGAVQAGLGCWFAAQSVDFTWDGFHEWIPCMPTATPNLEKMAPSQQVVTLHVRGLHRVKRCMFCKAAEESGVALQPAGRKLAPGKGSELACLELLDYRRHTIAPAPGRKPALVAGSRRQVRWPQRQRPGDEQLEFFYKM